MSTSPSERARSIRLWPGVAAATLLVLIRFVGPMVVPGFGGAATVVGLACGMVIVLWWLFFSRAPWRERVAAIVLMAAGLLATRPLVDQSIANGMMGMLLAVYGIQVMAIALVAWAVVSRGRSAGMRRASLVAAILIVCAGFTAIRTGGITGEADSDLHWRWTPTPEERLLARGDDPPLVKTSDQPVSPMPAGAPPSPAPSTPEILAPPRASVPAAAEPAGELPSPARVAPIARVADPEHAIPEAEWPGFRGPARDGVIRGVQIDTNWSQSPPVELWRRPIGPGWSSFAVRGDVVYTQEQRGDDEMVSCYRLSTGEPVWRHRDPVRFWESNGGAGPRGTPTLHGDRVYTLGATGILNALDAANGAVRWSRNAAADTGVKVPDWGVASSPLVIDGLVVVAVSGRLVAYDVRSGELRWLGPEGGAGYSSPHLVTIDGVTQIVLLRGSRTVSVAPADGALLWDHTWEPGVSIVQPAFATDRDMLIAAGDAMGGLGIRRIAVSHAPAGWTVEERWTSRGLKPYFNDFVVHEGHAYGFDASILAAIDLSGGTRKWKGGRYGHGQLVLLPEQDVLLVLSEDGELALVKATPDKYTELARLPALNGKTWNHPVVVGDVLLVRNGEEMAAFRLKRSR